MCQSSFSWLRLLRTLIAAKWVQLSQKKEGKARARAWALTRSLYLHTRELIAELISGIAWNREYTEIKGLVLGLIAMQLCGFRLLWKKKIHRGRVIIDLVSYIWEQEGHTEQARICDALFVSWWYVDRLGTWFTSHPGKDSVQMQNKVFCPFKLFLNL